MIPLEFEGLVSSDHPAARVGGARIELIPYRDKTHLGCCYQQVPVRLLPPFAFEDEPASLLYLINLTAGLLDGDAHRIEVAARAGTRALVTGQSATRVHPAVRGFSTQQWSVDVEDDACLIVLPGPVIPYRGCRYHQRARVSLAPGARLIWGDIWTPGRYLRGELSELFQFERIVQDFEVRRESRLVYRDRFRWDGPWSVDDARWHFGGGLVSASLFVTGPLPETTNPPSALFSRAVFGLESGDTCVRWCGDPAAVTADLAALALGTAGTWTGGAKAPPWFSEGGYIAPNHWFSALDAQT